MVLSDCIILLLDTDRLVLSIFTPTYYLPHITVSYSWSACQVLKKQKTIFSPTVRTATIANPAQVTLMAADRFGRPAWQCRGSIDFDSAQAALHIDSISGGMALAAHMHTLTHCIQSSFLL